MLLGMTPLKASWRWLCRSALSILSSSSTRLAFCVSVRRLALLLFAFTLAGSAAALSTSESEEQARRLKTDEAVTCDIAAPFAKTTSFHAEEACETETEDDGGLPLSHSAEDFPQVESTGGTSIVSAASAAWKTDDDSDNGTKRNGRRFTVGPVTLGSDPWAGCGIRLGIGSFAEPNPNYGILTPTVSAIRKAFPELNVCVRSFTTSALERAAASGEVNLFISSAGLYRRVLDKGVRDIASIMGPHITNPNEAEGSVFIVSKDRPDILNFETMRGLRLAANMPEGFTGFLAGMKEIADHGENPEGYFSEVGFYGHDQTKVIKAVLDGRADVGIVRACTFEEIIDVNPEYRGRLRTVVEREHAGFPCRHSTELYPSWVLVVTKTMPPAYAARVAAAVLAAPKTPTGLYWAIGTDFSAVDNLYRVLKLGPYEFLREWTLMRVWEEYKTAIIAAALIFLGLIAHGWRSEVLVKRRTAALEASIAQERALEARASKLRDRMQALQKIGVVGQISSLIAHELGQPLGAVRLYAHGLLRSIENGRTAAESLEGSIRRIDQQAERAQAILERVRAYAKSKTERRQAVDITKLLEEAVKNFRITSRGRIAEIVVSASLSGVFVSADPLEIELVVVNLLKNASEALREITGARIDVTQRLEKSGREVLIQISDNGPRLSDEAFAKLAKPFETSKTEGLGLGLSICRTIVELHGGRIEFSRGEVTGLVVTVRLPVIEKDLEAKDEVE